MIFIKFPLPRQSKLVPAGEKVIIWSERVPAGLTAYVTSIGNIMYRNIYLILKIDGMPVWNKIDFVIGNIANPHKLSEFIIAHKKIEWVCINNTDTDANVEVLCDGFMEKEG